jgi:hypothetical protein
LGERCIAPVELKDDGGNGRGVIDIGIAQKGRDGHRWHGYFEVLTIVRNSDFRYHRVVWR